MNTFLAGTMRFADYLALEWRPALGCTEPAAIAYACGLATDVAGGTPTRVELACDPRLYKNCYAVGIPNSNGRSGVLHAAAIGAAVAHPEALLEVFRHVNEDSLNRAGEMVDSGMVTARVDPERQDLWAEAKVIGPHGEARVVLLGDHTRVVTVELDGEAKPLPERDAEEVGSASDVRAALADLRIEELVDLARTIDADDREALRRGVGLNLAMAEHATHLLPISIDDDPGSPGRAAHLVSAGVYGRMTGEDRTVMTLAGSGNKGITCSVPLAVFAEQRGIAPELADEALALACLLTSAVTHHLGTLSAACGSSTAAGIGLAGGLVLMSGGDAKQISGAVTNMVGGVSGMVCDGAKIGCAMKCTTGVDTAIRASQFAMRGMVVPSTDGIVGADGEMSLKNLSRIAKHGLDGAEAEILAIMQEKLDTAREP